MSNTSTWHDRCLTALICGLDEYESVLASEPCEPLMCGALARQRVSRFVKEHLASKAAWSSTLSDYVCTDEIARQHFNKLVGSGGTRSRVDTPVVITTLLYEALKGIHVDGQTAHSSAAHQVDLLFQYLSDTNVVVHFVVPVNGLRTTERMDLYDDGTFSVAFGRLDAQQRNLFEAHLEPYTDPEHPWRLRLAEDNQAFIVATIRAPKSEWIASTHASVDTTHVEIIQRLARHVIDVCRLTLPVAVSAHTAIRVTESRFASRGSGQHIWSTNDPFAEAHEELDIRELDALFQVAPHVLSHAKYVELDPILRKKPLPGALRALHWVSNAKAEWRADSKIVLLMIAAEALCFSGSDRSTSADLCVRMALTGGHDAASAEDVHDLFKQAYRMRSDVVHGARHCDMSSIAALATQCEQVLTRVILRRIQNKEWDAPSAGEWRAMHLRNHFKP